MTLIDGDLWTAATHDHDAERLHGRISASRQALAATVAHVCGAMTDDGFSDRLALASDSIERVIARVTNDDPTDFPLVHVAVMDSIAADWRGTKAVRQRESQRRNAPRAFHRSEARRTAGRSNQFGSRMEGLDVDRLAAHPMAEGKYEEYLASTTDDPPMEYEDYVWENASDLADTIEQEWDGSDDGGRYASRRTAAGAFDWPLTPSRKNPGEDALTCPSCGSQNVILNGGNLGSDVVRGTMWSGIRCEDCGTSSGRGQRFNRDNKSEYHGEQWGWTSKESSRRTSALSWEPDGPGMDDPGWREQGESVYIDNEWGDSLAAYYSPELGGWQWMFTQGGPGVSTSRSGSASSIEEAKRLAEESYRRAGGSLDLDGSRWTASRRTAGVAVIPDNVGARDFSREMLLSQIDRMTIAAISGGRIGNILKGNKTVGITLPVSQGYSVDIYLADDDTYTVQRVFRGKVKGEQTNVYADEVDEAAYQASSYRSNDFGGHKVASSEGEGSRCRNCGRQTSGADYCSTTCEDMGHDAAEREGKGQATSSRRTAAWGQDEPWDEDSAPECSRCHNKMTEEDSDRGGFGDICAECRSKKESSRRTAGDGFGPDPDSQSGHAESTLPDVTVPSATEDTNMGWIEDDPGDEWSSEGRYGSRLRWAHTASRVAGNETLVWQALTPVGHVVVAKVAGVNQYEWSGERSGIEVEGTAPGLLQAQSAALAALSSIVVEGEFPPKKKDDEEEKKPEEKADAPAEEKPAEDAPPADPAAPAVPPADPAAPPASPPAPPADPAAPQPNSPTDGLAPAAPAGSPIPSAAADANTSAVVPSAMTPGEVASMAFTMADGRAGSVEVTFVREENGVYFMNGPTGEFGVGEQSGAWKDAQGNTFSFSPSGSAANAPEEQAPPVAAPPVPEAPAPEAPAEVPAEAPAEQPAAEEKPDDEDEEKKKKPAPDGEDNPGSSVPWKKSSRQ